MAYALNSYPNDEHREYPGPGSGIPCSHECESQSVAHCVTCEKYLCQECLTAHNKYRGHSGHSVKKRVIKKTKQKLVCEERGHEDKALKFYCETCEKLICRYCMDFNHGKQGHVCRIAREIAQKNRDSLAASNANLKNLLEEGEAFLKQLSIVAKRVEKHTENMKSEYAERKQTVLECLSDEFERDIKELNTKIDEIQGEKLQKLKQHADRTKDYVTSIQECVHSSTKLLEEGTDAEIISSRKVAKENEKTLVEQRSKHFKMPVTQLSVRHGDFVDISHIVNQLVAALSLGDVQTDEISRNNGESHTFSPRLGASYNNCMLKVYAGDIKKEETDAIIVPITREKYQEIKKFQQLRFGEIIVRHEKDLRCKMVFYAIVFMTEEEHNDITLTTLHQIILNSLVLASKHRANNVSLSAITLGLDVKDCARTTFVAVEKFLKGLNKSLQQICFVNGVEKTSIFLNEMVCRYQSFKLTKA